MESGRIHVLCLLSVYLISNESTYKISNCLFVPVLFYNTSLNAWCQYSMFAFFFVSLASENLAVGLKFLVVISQGDLKLVRFILILLPGGFSFSLLTSKALVLVLNLLVHIGSLLCHLVLKHTFHAIDSLLLSSIASFIVSLLSCLLLVLSLFLVSPLVDRLCILHHSVIIH